jgi:hypothetical protein
MMADRSTADRDIVEGITGFPLKKLQLDSNNIRTP